jgi:hypothetical protein
MLCHNDHCQDTGDDLGFRDSNDAVTMTEDDLEFWVLETAMTCHNDHCEDTGDDLGFRVQR